MALVVETGTGSATSESYISVTAADTYHSDRANTAWAALTTANKEAYLRRAAEYMTEAYRLRWAGARKTTTQALDWPRSFVPLLDSLSGYMTYPAYVADDVVPVEVQRACAELALTASTATLAPNLDRAVISETVGPISVDYDQSAPLYTRYRAVDMLLQLYLIGSAVMLQLKRA